MNIGVVVNVEKDEGLKYTRILLDSINTNGAKYIVCEKIASKLGLMENSFSEEDLIEMSDIIVCLGEMVHFKGCQNDIRKDVPIIGINLET